LVASLQFSIGIRSCRKAQCSTSPKKQCCNTEFYRLYKNCRPFTSDRSLTL